MLCPSSRALPRRYFERGWIAAGATSDAMALATIDIPAVPRLAHEMPPVPATRADVMPAQITTNGSLIHQLSAMLASVGVILHLNVSHPPLMLCLARVKMATVDTRYIFLWGRLQMIRTSLTPARPRHLLSFRLMMHGIDMLIA